MRLTDISVRNLPCPTKGQRTYFDDTLAGFGCRVSQGGTKSFVVQHGVDRRLITIGRYPVISLADAREEAKRLLAEMTLGRHRPRTARWDEALDLYLAACEEKNRKRTVDDYRRIINRHFAFKRQQLAEITPDDIERKLGNIKAPAERNHALVAVKGTPLEQQKPVDPLDLVRMVAVARITMPQARVRLSAGRAELSREAQALCFMAGANSIFYGEKLLTTGNPPSRAIGVDTSGTTITATFSFCRG